VGHGRHAAKGVEGKLQGTRQTRVCSEDAVAATVAPCSLHGLTRGMNDIWPRADIPSKGTTSSLS
jgi:hypothetical protein